MLSQIKTLLTNHSSACITQANKLAQKNNKKTIHREDLFWGISMFFKSNQINSIFWKLIGLPEDILEDYRYEYYKTEKTLKQNKKDKMLPLNKKLIQSIQKYINTNTKKLDLDVLFLASFYNMSNQFVDHLDEHQIKHETIINNYKKLNKNPMIQQM